MSHRTLLGDFEDKHYKDQVRPHGQPGLLVENASVGEVAFAICLGKSGGRSLWRVRDALVRVALCHSIRLSMRVCCLEPK